jgi:hypothetical protein
MSRITHRLSSVRLWAALSLVIYVLFALFFPLVPHYSWVPTLDIRSFAPSLWQGLGYGLLLLLVYGFYLGAYRSAQAAPLRLGAILGVAALLALPLLFVYPINAADIFRYFISGRLTAFYGTSPLAVAPAPICRRSVPAAGRRVGRRNVALWPGMGANRRRHCRHQRRESAAGATAVQRAGAGGAPGERRPHLAAATGSRAQGGAYAALGLEPSAVADVRRRRA